MILGRTNHSGDYNQHFDFAETMENQRTSIDNKKTQQNSPNLSVPEFSNFR